MFMSGHVRGMGENRDGGGEEEPISRYMEKAIKKSDTWKNNQNKKKNQNLNARTPYG